MSNNRQFEQKIKEALRNSPEDDSLLLSSSACEARRVAFLNRIGVENTARPVYTFRDYFQYYSWNFTHGFLLPAAAGFAMVLFVIGGWVTVATASQDTLPGDTLYSVKISSEKLQLGLTIDAEKRAQLHMAFASRRLSEMSALNAQQASAQKDERLQVAMDGFKSQVSSVTSALQSLPERSNQAVSVARQVETKVQEYKQVTKVAEVTEVVEEASDVAVEVMMSNAEEGEADSSAADEVRATFSERIEVINTAIQLMHGRITMLKEIQASVALDQQTLAVRDVVVMIEEAIALMNDGAFRTAFELTDKAQIAIEIIDTVVSEIEQPTEEVIEQTTVEDTP
ncbi:MAG: DUF5667 domain-containing protein [Patescibacteria group bacterium]